MLIFNVLFITSLFEITLERWWFQFWGKKWSFHVSRNFSSLLEVEMKQCIFSSSCSATALLCFVWPTIRKWPHMYSLDSHAVKPTLLGTRTQFLIAIEILGPPLGHESFSTKCSHRQPLKLIFIDATPTDNSSTPFPELVTRQYCCSLLV